MGGRAPSGRLISRHPHRIPLALGFQDDEPDASCPFPFLPCPVILTTGRPNINGRVAARGFRATVTKHPKRGLNHQRCLLSQLWKQEPKVKVSGVGCQQGSPSWGLGGGSSLFSPASRAAASSGPSACRCVTTASASTLARPPPRLSPLRGRICVQVPLSFLLQRHHSLDQGPPYSSVASSKLNHLQRPYFQIRPRSWLPGAKT